MNINTTVRIEEKTAMIPSGGITLEGSLGIPQDARGLVLIAEGAGSNRQSPRNRFLADELRQEGLATLMVDLLTPKEEACDMRTGNLRYDIDLLSRRTLDVTDWIDQSKSTMHLSLGILGMGIGSVAAMMAAAQQPQIVKALVSKSGRLDLAGNIFPRIKAPTLLVVGGFDYTVVEVNRRAYLDFRVPKDLIVVPEATQLFEEPGALEKVAHLATRWFHQYLDPKWKQNFE